jgi:hypothetical protein
MSGKDAFVRGYASANDDIRHHVIERGWFGSETRSDAMRRDVDATIAQYDHELSHSAWGQLPDGERPVQDGRPYDPYGDRDAEPSSRDLYGPGREEVEAGDLYGDGHAAEPQREELYGPERDIEHDRE